MGDEVDEPPSPPSPPSGPPRGTNFSRRKLSAPLAAVPGRDVDFDFVDEHAVSSLQSAVVQSRSRGQTLARDR